MTWKHWRRLLVPTCLLTIGTTLVACDLGVSWDLAGPRSPPPASGGGGGACWAITVSVWPSLTDSLGMAFGTIRDGSYTDSLRVSQSNFENMNLSAGLERPGIYRVTIAAPGYVTCGRTPSPHADPPREGLSLSLPDRSSHLSCGVLL